MKNYYEVLGLSKKATASEIKSAFKKMAKEHHPDLGGDPEKFKNINEAYQVLNDSTKKADYDIKLNIPNRGRFSFSFDEFFKSRQTSYDSTDGYDDPFVKSHYGDSTNTHYNKPKQKTKGSDLKISLEIYPEDTIIDFAKKFTYNRNIICKSCNCEGHTSTTCQACKGTGVFRILEDYPAKCSNCDGTGKIHLSCNTCNGEGFIKEKKEVKINIPKGVTIATITRMKGFGNQGSNGEYGDLIIYVKDIISSSKFQMSPGVKDKYIFTEEVINFFDAITGIDLQCNTLRGAFNVSIKPMQIFKNHKVTIPNAGIPKHFGKQEYTPHIIFFHIQYPELSEEQIEYIKKIKDTLNGNNGTLKENSGQNNPEIDTTEDNVTEHSENKKE